MEFVEPVPFQGLTRTEPANDGFQQGCQVPCVMLDVESVSSGIEGQWFRMV